MRPRRTGWGRVRAALLVPITLAAGLILLPAAPAYACSCVDGSVADDVRRADAVYVARPGRWDIWPDEAFRVRRVLKGPARSNLRVRVELPRLWSHSSCATSLVEDDYVIPLSDGRMIGLSHCTSHLVGSAAVREAEELLGRGEPVRSRPSPAWVAQWVLAALLPLSLIGLIVLRRRRSSTPGATL